MQAKAGWCYKAPGVKKYYVIHPDFVGYTFFNGHKNTTFKRWGYDQDREAVAPKELMYWTD